METPPDTGVTSQCDGEQAGAQQVVSASDDTQSARPNDLVEVGVMGEAYGVRGWVKIYPHASVDQDDGNDKGSKGGSSDSALLAAKRWWLVRDAQQGSECRVADVLTAKRHSSIVVAQLAGCADRNAGEALKGYRVQVRRADFPRLSGDEFYWVDLIGLDVVNQDGASLGTVANLIDNGAHSILRVEYPAVDGDAKEGTKPLAKRGGKEVKSGPVKSEPVKSGPVENERLIPFVDIYVKHVDLTARKIVVDWELDY